MSSEETLDPNSPEPNPCALGFLDGSQSTALPGTSPAQGATSDDAPPSLPGYRIVRPLGRGGMGVVWLAMQEATKRPVALKIVGGQFFNAAVTRARFEREVQLSARLEHPHIARLYDSGIFQGICYYAMELIDGSDLDAFVRAGKCDDDAIVRLMIQVSRGVQHAHQRGIIHRDLKPGNVLLGQDGQPKVTDFGLARLVQSEPQGSLGSITIEGTATGTPGYMSPEQARGEDDHVDTRADVFSLGAMLFTLLCRKPAYDLRGTLYDVLQRIAESEPARPRAVRGDLDPELEAIIVKAMAFTQEQRYGSAGELADDLQRFIDGAPILARKQTTVYLLGKSLKKHRVKFAIAAAVALTALAGVIYSNYLIVKQRNEAVAQRDRAVAAEHAAQLAEKSAQAARADAEANLGVANDAVKQFLARVGSASLANVPGVRPLREMLMTDATNYYRQLLAKTPASTELNTSLSEVLQSHGGLAAEAQDWKHAIEYDEEAIKLMRALPDQAKQQRRMASLMSVLADNYYHGGDNARALEYVSASAALVKQILADTPGDEHIKALNTVNSSIMSMAQSAQGKPDEAIALALQNIAATESKVKDKPYELANISTLGFAYSGLADLYTDVGDRAKMEAASQKSIEQLKKVTLARPADFKSRSYYARCYSDYGQRLSVFNDYDAARKQINIAIDLVRGDLDNSSSVGLAKVVLGRNLSELGRTFIDQSRFAEAEPLIRQSVEIYRQLAAGEPGFGEGMYGLSYQLTLMADTEAGLAHADQAEAMLAEATALAVKVHPDPNESRRSRQLYSRLYTAKATALAAADQRDASLAAANQAIPLLQGVGDTDFKVRRELARIDVIRAKYGLATVSTGQPTVVALTTPPPAAVEMAIGEPASRPAMPVPAPSPATAPSVTTLINATDAPAIANALGKVVTVGGKVSQVTHSPSGGVTFIRFKGNKVTDFTCIIYGSKLADIKKELGGAPEDVWVGKSIEVTGQMSQYKNQPQIIIGRADQVHVMPTAATQP